MYSIARRSFLCSIQNPARSANRRFIRFLHLRRSKAIKKVGSGCAMWFARSLLARVTFSLSCFFLPPPPSRNSSTTMVGRRAHAWTYDTNNDITMLVTSTVIRIGMGCMYVCTPEVPPELNFRGRQLCKRDRVFAGSEDAWAFIAHR